jgi:RNA polymerase sigma factor (TIGR02999 family)
MSHDSPVTQSLKEIRAGKDGAFHRLVGLLYDDLRRMAAHYLDHNAAGRTLNPTGLVHEAYLRLAAHDELKWEDRAHFMAACSIVMRNIVIDFARRQNALKRGGGPPVPLDDREIRVDSQAEELIALDDALDRLATYGERLPRVVECRFFAGLTEPETASALGISERTVRRDWVKARTLLSTLLADDPPGSPA